MMLRPSTWARLCRRGTLCAVTAGLALWCWTAPALASSVVRADLTQVTSAAQRIFVGHVVTVRSGRDEHGIPSTWTTFAVTDVIKGTVRNEVTIKQVGDGVVRVPGIPRFSAGDEAVLFMSGESVAGFSSPIGLEQGRFSVTRRNGRAVVTLAGEGLDSPSGAQRAASARTTQMDLDAFVTTVKQLLGNAR